MDSIIKSNERMRKLFEEFLESDTFNEVISIMKDDQIGTSEFFYGNHRVKIEDYSQSSGSNSQDAQEAEAERNGKYFRIDLMLNGDETTDISAHRIVNPRWWAIQEPPENEIYLVGSCWVHAKSFFNNHELLEETVQEILDNVKANEIHDYEAISIPK